MNPLSSLTYCRRHKRGVLSLAGLIGLVTLGVCVMVRLLDLLVEQNEIVERYLTRFSVVSAVGPVLEPGIGSQIRAHPDVVRVIPEASLYIGTPMNTGGGFRLLGVPEADVQTMIDLCDLRLKEGRLLRARANEVMLSEELADALGLRIGDSIGRPIDEEYYWDVPTTMALVGILESVETPSSASEKNVLTGFVSYEYLEGHELYAPLSPSLIVIVEEGRKAEVDRFLETTISPSQAEVWTWRRSAEMRAQGALFFHLIFGVVDCLVAVVVALVVGAIHQIGLTQRLADFGLLHAVGHRKRRLLCQLAVETAVVAGGGWLAGLALSWALFAWLGTTVLPPSIELDLANLAPIGFAAPIPLAVIAFVMVSLARTFSRLDAVAIIERGKLSMEPGDHWQVAGRSSSRPLSSWTFYRRHRRRGVMLVATMALMILGVAFPAFLFVATVDANLFRFAHLRYASVVLPRGGGSVDPGVMAQVRTHPAVARVVPTIQLGLTIVVPPLSQNPARIYGVSEEDMQFLIDLYGMRLEEGRLPYSRANEIVVSRSIAMNRSLHVGDKVGRPVYEDDRGIPTEMVVVGILSVPADKASALGAGPPQSLRQSDTWLADAGRMPAFRFKPLQSLRQSDVWLVGFAPYEYLRSHELYASRPASLLVVPAGGRKDELDAWLEEEVASEGTSVQTFGTRSREHRELTLVMLLLCAVVESIIALVAALALAALSYVFIVQRREEFGILNALGRRRPWLVLRTVGETASVVAASWMIGAAVCMAGLIYVQAVVYVPMGLSLDLLNPAPWLFTLPMPLAVVAAGAGLVAWMLSRLDPVSIIERR